MKKVLSLLLAAICVLMSVPCVNAAYTTENDVYTWDLKDITEEIGYDETAFQGGASYSYNGLKIVGMNSASAINENGVKIGKVSNKWGYIEYTAPADGTLSVTANIGKSGSYYSKIFVSTSSTSTDAAGVVIAGSATGSFSGETGLDEGTTYYIYNNSSASAYIESITFTPGEKPIIPTMTLNNTFSDNMLIQRDKPIILKGSCEYVQSAEITLQNDNNEADTRTKAVDLNGLTEWKAELEALSNYTDTYTLTITPRSEYEGAKPIVISNIIFGDLYLCAGQSNMVASASDYKTMGIDYTSEQLSAKHDDIRCLDLANKHTYSSSVKETIVDTASWKVLQSGSIPAVAYSFAEKLNSETGIPVGIITSSVKGTYISQWLPNIGIDSNNKNKNLYNTGIYPFRDMQLSGILWYQGESDSRESDKYKDKLKNLINTYRNLFANTEEVPFYFVSIVRCGTFEEDTMFEHMSDVRAIQAEVYSELKEELGNFGIIPTLDLYGNKENDTTYSDKWGISRGNARSSIHPGQKPIIAERAVNWVLRDIYGQENINTIGPVYKSKSSADGKLTVEFECTGNLKLMDTEQYSDNDAAAKRAEYGIDETKPQEFEIAGEDGVYYRAEAELDGNTVILSSDKVANPINFRYAYLGRNGDAYIECPNLTDDTNLPALVASTAAGTSGDEPESSAAPTTEPDTPTAEPTKEPAEEPEITNGRIVYSEDFSDSDISAWTDAKSVLSVSNDETHGNYLSMNVASSDSGAYTLFEADTKPILQYVYECDVRLKAGNDKSTQLSLMSEDYVFSSGNVNYGVGSGYILKLTTVNSTDWTINPDTTNKTVTIPQTDWVHLAVSYDSASNTTWLKITNNDEVLYSGAIEPHSTKNIPVGIHLRGGKNNAVMDVDNLTLSVVEDDSFTDYSEFKNEDYVGVVIMPNVSENIYAALYNKDGVLIGIKTVKGSGTLQTLKFPLPQEDGTYMKIFNWTDDMQPLCGASKPIYTDDIDEQNTDYLLNGKTVYAFGDSIVYGHKTPEKSFMRLMADDYDMNLGMYAVNGASVICVDSLEKEDASEEKIGNYIIKQVQNAPSEAPDVIIFDGYTNDAYGDPATDSFNSKGNRINILENLGEIQGRTASEFDNQTFCGAFEEIIHTMKQKWPDTLIVFVTIHKSGGRNWEVQSKLCELAIEMCGEWGVEIADVFNDTTLDSREAEQMQKYIISAAGSHPNETACREFYIPLLSGKLKEIFSASSLPDNIEGTVDLAIFAGQSNMSGRGNAAEATVCDVNAGFEYKAISNPLALVPVTEPFGLGEDKEGAIADFNSDGTTKRTGSMVSAVVDEYYKQTGRQLVAVSASKGGTSTAEWKSNYINDAADRLDAAEKYLASNGINIGRIFVVWCQGESDGDNNVSADTYTANTKELFNVFKQHGAEKCFMVQIGHYRDGGTMDTRYGVIRDAQAALCESDTDFILAGSFEPYKNDMKDKYHYNQTTYNAVGKTVGENISKYYGVD